MGAPPAGHTHHGGGRPGVTAQRSVWKFYSTAVRHKACEGHAGGRVGMHGVIPKGWRVAQQGEPSRAAAGIRLSALAWGPALRRR